ncbi:MULTISPECIES: hypothetical protein [unclassified Paenibacillus]|uniref:hypothetical protein n=1 Tax=unclassified Paenibacillus TaxID=185978 RepID=UPI0024062869|nr:MULTISPECIES: hypothetical protein [unclassified Paenibacillus]MDF9843416.1 hypothetical protein [Paenibacillus sp. PastF-2]MDF9850003.1 hypothetical protein [Paenibacillus sp. PastM-2]MDF9856711.1 hypothetical protein [Paenibacillus sp. PastF-1]MDH6481982.1 hypothetical protein [Paenibacillus sp. PastH-2]MDH6509406.1 hypothetical protein [Paenibacillus sp. PastM-3]
MYKPTVVTGRIIEVHADRVLTQQGDMFCTYNPRYYKLPDAELWTQAEYEPDKGRGPVIEETSRQQVPKKRWNRRLPLFSLQKKSANRI